MHAALGLALSTMVWIVAFVIGMCFGMAVMLMAYVASMGAALWCGMGIAGCIGSHSIERGYGNMACDPHAIQLRLVFCMFVPTDTYGMATFGFGEQSWNSFMNLLLQVWFAPMGAFMATFSDEFGGFDLTMVLSWFWSCYHMDLVQQVIFAEILYRDARFVCFGEITLLL